MTAADTIRGALTSVLGRIILAVYTLIIVPVLPTLINFVNTTLGYNISDAEITVYANKAALAIAGLAAVWLLNKGLFERKAIEVAQAVGVDLDKKVEKKPLA
jgi:hypothetical protein